MKNILFPLLFVLMIFSCQKYPGGPNDPNQPNHDQSSSPSFDFEIPDDFDWNIYKTVEVSIGVPNNYDGGLDYVIEVIQDSIVQVQGKAGVGKYFNTRITVLKETSKLTINQKNPYGKLINSAEVTIPNGKLDYVFPASDVKSSSTNLVSSVEREYVVLPTVSESVPTSGKLVAGKTYLVPAGSSVTIESGKMVGGVNIYVAGSLTIKSMYSIHDVNFGVTSSGTLTFSGNITNSERLKIINDGSTWFKGAVKLKDSEIINNNNIDGQAGNFALNGVKLTNYHYINCYNFYMTSADDVVLNYGKISAAYQASLTTGTLTIADGAMLKSAFQFTAGAGTINLLSGSKLLIGGNVTFRGTTVVNSDNFDYSVIICNRFYIDNKQAVEGKICIDPTETLSDDGFEEEVVIGNQSHLIVPTTEYNENGYNSEFYDDKIITYRSTVYTAIMEDNFPDLGDMDMNDLVCTWQFGTYNNPASNNIEKIGIKYSIRAVGAGNKIAAAVKIANLSPTNVRSTTLSKPQTFNKYFVLDINGVESGNTQTVVPLFEDARSLFGAQGFVNTESVQYQPYDFEVIIPLKDGISASSLSPEDIDLFLVVDGDTKTRTEIHLFGNMTTPKASNNTDFTISEQVWGIQLGNNFKHSKERVPIDDAYSEFRAWATTGGKENTNWYNNPDDSKVLGL